MTSVAQGAAFRSYLDVEGRRGILAWILSTDHKRIGILYLASLLTSLPDGDDDRGSHAD